MLTTLLLVLMIGIVTSVYFVKNNYLLILCAALFSFCAASVYFLNAAPDLALAEIAIGSAFVPLIFTIAIMRQNTFTVVFFSQEGKQAYCDPEILIEFMGVAEVFCEHKRLKLKIITHPMQYEPSVRGIFRLGNTDLIAHYFEEENYLKVWGNIRNKLLIDLIDGLEDHPRIQFEEMGGEWVDE